MHHMSTQCDAIVKLIDCDFVYKMGNGSAILTADCTKATQDYVILNSVLRYRVNCHFRLSGVAAIRPKTFTILSFFP